MAHLLPQLRCQFAEFLNDCQLKRLRILYQLTCGSFQVRFYILKEAQYSLFSLFTSIFIYILRLYAFPEHFTTSLYVVTYNLLIILSFRFNLETDSLSHKLKARGPLRGILFFVTRVSILTWDIYGNPLSSEQTTNVIMKIDVAPINPVFIY